MPKDDEVAADKPAVVLPDAPPPPNRNPVLTGMVKGKVVSKVVPIGGGVGVGAPDAPQRRPEGEGRGR